VKSRTLRHHSVTAVLDIHEYYLCSSLGRSLHCTTFDDANDYSSKVTQSGKFHTGASGLSAGRHHLLAKVDQIVKNHKFSTTTSSFGILFRLQGWSRSTPLFKDEKRRSTAEGFA
jgi:hypothetical protein